MCFSERKKNEIEPLCELAFPRMLPGYRQGEKVEAPRKGDEAM